MKRRLKIEGNDLSENQTGDIVSLKKFRQYGKYHEKLKRSTF